jgi:hypothetical protein
MSHVSLITLDPVAPRASTVERRAAGRRLRWAEPDLAGVALRAGMAAVPFTGIAWLFVAH